VNHFILSLLASSSQSTHFADKETGLPARFSGFKAKYGMIYGQAGSKGQVFQQCNLTLQSVVYVAVAFLACTAETKLSF